MVSSINTTVILQRHWVASIWVIIFTLLAAPLHSQFITNTDEAPIHTAGAAFIPSVSGKETTPLISNLGAAVNSRYEDLNPIISADGKTLYFVRKHAPSNMGGRQDPQDIYVANLVRGKWTNGRNLGPAINTSRADNLCGISPDHGTLYFFVRSSGNNGYFGFRQKTSTGWSAMQSTGLEITSESPYLESWVSADANTVLFTARTRQNLKYQKGLDERDIYVSIRKPDGTWTRPLNLGGRINTSGDEYSPFLASDGRTLYFASNGRPGFGEVDLYVARRNGAGWNDWSEPESLGPHINSAGFDGYFSVTASGEVAYLSTRARSYGKSDIVSVVLPERLRPARAPFLYGVVYDAKTKEAVPATISVLEDEQRIDEVTCRNGHYSSPLRHRTVFRVIAKSDGYASVERQVIVNELAEEGMYRVDFALIRLSRENTSFATILFDEGRSNLRPGTLKDLDRLVEVLRDNPGIILEVRGHTDNRGQLRALRELSLQRTRQVIRYLASSGIDPGRLRARGFGPSEPAAKNDTEENRKKNRRVEFRLRKW